MLAKIGLAVIVTLSNGQIFNCEQAHVETGLVTCLNQCGQERCDGSIFCNSEDLIPSSSVKQIELNNNVPTSSNR